MLRNCWLRDWMRCGGLFENEIGWTGHLQLRIGHVGQFSGTAIAAAAGVLFGVYEQQSALQFLLTVPEIVWEASFGLYLVVKGFKQAPVRPEDAGRVALATAPAVG